MERYVKLECTIMPNRIVHTKIVHIVESRNPLKKEKGKSSQKLPRNYGIIGWGQSNRVPINFFPLFSTHNN